MIDVPVSSADVLFESLVHSRAETAVAVTLYNYADVVGEALESVRNQELPDVDLVVVDDCSTDDASKVVLRWLEVHHERFGRAILVRNSRNEGLATARNQGFMLSQTPYVFVLDADNLIYPRCLATCTAAAQLVDADAAYTLLEEFGEAEGVKGTDLWNPAALRRENYIDAMALVRRTAWEWVGGYRHMPASGWEDYDFWLKFAEAGFKVVRVPEILCRYRVRASSMLRTTTNKPDVADLLHADLRAHHPFVEL
jgi:glycosyltransferase involved in cell wall biosynthesis